jgi:hypothetical protein
MPKKLKVDLNDLIFAMRNHDVCFDQYIDLTIGKISDKKMIALMMGPWLMLKLARIISNAIFLSNH